MSNKTRGRRAEFLARIFLRLKGYRILQKNFITGRGTTAGEVDIIAQKKNMIVFVEVKARGRLENALYAIKAPQQKRILTAARVYLAKNQACRDFDVRFDAVLVFGLFKIRHIQNAWQA